MSDSVERVIAGPKVEAVEKVEEMSLPAEITAIEEAGLPGEVSEVEMVEGVEEMKLADQDQVESQVPNQPEANNNTEEGSTTDQLKP